MGSLSTLGQDVRRMDVDDEFVRPAWQAGFHELDSSLRSCLIALSACSDYDRPPIRVCG